MPRNRRPEAVTDAPPAIQRQSVLAGDGTVLREAIVEPAEWADPEDNAPNRRSARLVHGFRTTSPLVNLHRRSPREITAEHVRAAERLTADYELSEGARGGQPTPMRVTGAAGVGPTDGQIDALARFRDARVALGRLAQYVLPVVLSGWTVERLATAYAMRRDRVHGRLAAGLDVLCGHYWPDKPGVSRAPVYVVDPAVADIPQDRLGRVVR